VGPFWGLLHPHIRLDALPASPKLSRNGRDLHFLGMQFMDLLLACDSLLMELKAFGFQMLPPAGLPGSHLLCLLFSEVLGWLLDQGFELRLFGEEEALQGF